MWFGAVDTESMQKQSESLVGDSQRERAEPGSSQQRGGFVHLEDAVMFIWFSYT